ncbi:MAG: hypothetical protein R6X05_15085 [Desulfobacterales bacterium]|jgi:hypothetical protein
MKSFIDFLFIGIKENLGNLYEGLTNIDQIFKQHVAIIQAIKTWRGRQYRGPLHEPDPQLPACRRQHPLGYIT